MTHIESISCGQGGPSLFLITMAGEGLFPCDVVIVADTGWERDMLWSDGRRTDAATFFEEVTKPLANSYGIDAEFVRTRDKDGNEYLPLDEHVSMDWNRGRTSSVPMYGSKGGKLMQSCTSRWKIRAVRQELRRRGATTARTHLGLTVEEMHRMKINDVNWNWIGWPMINYTTNQDGETLGMGMDRTWRRTEVQDELARRGIPYITTSECDGCPHKDLPRWERTSPETLAELAEFEAQFDGDFFLTRQCIPLLESIKQMKAGQSLNFFDELDTCESGYCFT